MRFRSVLVVVSLCLVLGTSAAFGAEAPSRGLEARELPGILGHLEAFLKAVWANLGSDIDPLGRTSPEADAESGDDPSEDIGFKIDPLG